MNQLSPRFLPPSRALLFVMLTIALSATGCGGKKHTARNVPSAPAPSAPTSRGTTSSKHNLPGRDRGALVSVPGIQVDPNAKVLWSEVGYACWYGPKFHNKKAANGEIFNQNAMTAAHNTLPLNSIVRVVNLKSHQAAVVRITDRGPVGGDRIIDLSAAAAKAIDIYISGTARVRLDVLETPHPTKLRDPRKD